jgi:hypothetical protein
MVRLAPPKVWIGIGVVAATLMASAGNAFALSLFEQQPYQREISAAWSAVDEATWTGMNDVAALTAQAADAPARPHWRSEFNPLSLANTGGNGFIQPALPIDRQASPPQPAALAMTGIGLATFLGGRRKTKAGGH